MPKRYKLPPEEVTAVAALYNRMDSGALREEDPDMHALAQALGKFVAQNLPLVDVLPEVLSLEIVVPDDPPAQPTRAKLVIVHNARQYTMETDGAGRLGPFPWKRPQRKRRS